jgi:hypothetical protein
LVVHVRIRIRGGGKEMETKAAVNTYFSADEPLLAAPSKSRRRSVWRGREWRNLR